MPGTVDALPEATRDFYRSAVLTLDRAGVPFLVGGAFAFNVYTGISRYTKDFDVFVRPADADDACRAFRESGLRVDCPLLHWLSKAYEGEDFVDIITGLGNGMGVVDEGWFENARPAEVLDATVLLCPPEEMIWAGSFVMERERFDGSEVAHLLRASAETLDWNRLRDRYGENWRVLLSHLVLFGFIYPGERARVPAWLMDDLLARLEEESRSPAPQTNVCRGTLLSGTQYNVDLERGLEDARPPQARGEPRPARDDPAEADR